jgi:S-formylglutathione hydrolase FrmB
LVDHTHNHGADRRIWSPTLGQKRDLYVYLPPGYDPGRCYPVLIWLHGIFQDEQEFPEYGLPAFDAAIASGQLPPLIIAIPDGTLTGRVSLFAPYTFLLNSKLGPFEDYIVNDLWAFLTEHYPIRPERQAHLVGGFSGGGFSAYRLAIRYRQRFGVVFAFSAPLNVRWVDCHGRYMSKFDPDCWGWREKVRGHEVVARFYGVVTFRMGQFVHPLFGSGPEAIAALSANNPIEMLEQYDIRPGELPMYLAYGGKDEFNVPAHAESFLYRAAQRHLQVTVDFDPEGRHSTALVRKTLPGLLAWLASQLNAAKLAEW